MPYKLEQIFNEAKVKPPIYNQLIKYYDYCQFTRNFTYNTMCGKVSAINHFVSYSGLQDIEYITNDQIYRWMGHQTDKGNRPRTVNNRLKHLLAMLRYYRDYGAKMPNLILPEIQKQTEDPPSKRAFSRELVYQALRYADRDAWLMIKICFDCGLRIQELHDMKLQQINGNQLEIIGKGKKRRFAILSDEVMVRLEDWILRNRITNYIWASHTKPRCPMTVEAMRAKMRAPFEAAGVYGFCPHELRHSYATDLKRLDASTRSIQLGLGHASELTTERYLHDLDGSDLEDLYKLKYSAKSPEIV